MPPSQINPEQASASALLGDSKRAIDTYLAEYFATEIAKAGEISPRYATLWQTLAELSAAGGKRLRPYMVILAYTSFAKSPGYDQVLPAAAACELIHLAMLIHDDIIDRDDMRYGVHNISGQYMAQYQHLTAHDRRHFANSAAMLGGDVLLSQGHRLLYQCDTDQDTMRAVQEIFATSISHVVGGELIDVESAFTDMPADHSLIVARYKTASYSFVGPLCIGAKLAGVDDDTLEHIKTFAVAVGTAFQLQDDLLGTFGDEAITGKSTATDLREGKQTYLIEQFGQIASDEDNQVFERLFGIYDMSDADLAQLKQIIRDSGAIQAVQQKVAEFRGQALDALELLDLPDDQKQQYEALISLAIDRDK